MAHYSEGFVRGFLRAFDMGRHYRKKRDYSGAKLKDYYAIMKDWRSVGDDIWKAEKQFKPAGK